MSAAHAVASPALVDAASALVARTPSRGGPIVVGINGPQGGGKSTLAAAVVARARAAGRRAIAISIDDFYLTHAEQRDLAARHPGNRYLEHRGYPGTHDVALGAATLRALRAAPTGEAITWPAYDKSAHGGRGDRAARSTWPRDVGPLDLIVFEGWMLGFSPGPQPADVHLAAASALLGAYAAWHVELDAFVHLEARDPRDIVAWRIDAERSRRASGAPALTDDEARDYIERFLPAYALWVPGLRQRPLLRGGEPLPALWARLASDRSPERLEDR